MNNQGGDAWMKTVVCDAVVSLGGKTCGGATPARFLSTIFNVAVARLFPKRHIDHSYTCSQRMVQNSCELR